MASGKLSSWIKQLLLLFTVLFVAVGSGWFGDAIGERFNEGMYLWTRSFWEFESWRWEKLGFGALLFLTGAILAYWLRREFLPVQVLEHTDTVIPARVLIAVVSSRNFDFDGPGYDRLVIRRGDRILDEVELSGDLEEDCQRNGKAHWNWQQLLRAIWPHVEKGKLERIHLIGSGGPGDRGGSFEQLDECRSFLQRYLPDGFPIESHGRPVDFEDLDDLQAALKAEVEKSHKALAGLKNKDIMLDCTGGPKTASIAVALYTTHHPRLHFQYVDNQGRVQYFDIIAEKEGEIS